jgi:hypothetical protein
MDFRTMKISFCKKSGDNVVESDSKQQIIDILKTNYNLNFKSNRAMILNQRSLSYLRANPHLISIKSIGSNYFLFFTRINDTNCVFYIDRKVKQGYTLPRIISVMYSFSDEVFNDTLLDGELIKDKNNNWMFLISDMIIYKGKSLTCNIVDRFNKIYEMLDNDYKDDEHTDICPLRVKRLFNYSEYNELITHFIPKLSYNIRGLYFNTLHPKHCNQLFMYKDQKRVTEKKIDKNEEVKTFEIRSTIQPEIYDLYHIKNKDITKYDVARISGMRTSKLVRKLFNESTSDSAIYVKCHFNNKFNKWEPFDIGNKEDLDGVE